MSTGTSPQHTGVTSVDFPGWCGVQKAGLGLGARGLTVRPFVLGIQWLSQPIPAHPSPSQRGAHKQVSCLGNRYKVLPLSSEAWSGARTDTGGQLGPDSPGEGGPGASPFLPPSPGPSLSCFHWPRGVQACARLQQLLEWTRSAGFGEAGERFFRKLSCTLNLLATPRAQLIQVGGVGWGPCVVTLGSPTTDQAEGHGPGRVASVPQLFPPVGRIMAPKMSVSGPWLATM